MSNEDIKKKIQESLQKAGVSSSKLNLDKAVANGDAEAMYQKACLIVNKKDLNFKGDTKYWEIEIDDRPLAH